MKNYQLIFKNKILTGFTVLLISITSLAQVPPAGKYNTTNYLEDRKAIEALQMVQDSSEFLNDDLIAVGPEGKVSYGFKQWKKGFTDSSVAFKSVVPRPGTYILRIYNGDAAVKNMIVDVVFSSPKGDLFITVVRTETYIKKQGRWYFVSGQGTKLASAEERAERFKQALKKE